MKILITGASGFVGSHLGHRLRPNHEILGWTHSPRKPLPFPTAAIELLETSTVTSGLDEFQPEVIVHLAAMSKVMECEDDPDAAQAINVNATSAIAEWAAAHSARLIFVSSDQVFDGHSGPYGENESPAPVNVYGRTKYEAEQVVLSQVRRSLIVRSNSVVGPAIGWGQSFTDLILERLRANPPFRMFQDQYRSPIHIRRMTDVLETVGTTEISGILHAGGPEPQSRFETGLSVAKAYGIDLELILPASFRDHPRAEIMHADGRFKITKLQSLLPEITWKPLAEEFAEDAAAESSDS